MVKGILKLIRLPNLLILAAAMYLMRLMAVEPLLILSRIAPEVSSLEFLLIVTATVLVAAGGNVINDIEDVQTDTINRPQKVVVGKTISNDTAWNLYLILTFAGVCLGFYLTFFEKVHYVAYVEIIAAGLLYFYSTTYKKIMLLGNVIVSALTAAAIALPYLTEPAGPTVEPLKYLATGYALFAFILSMAREIIKDMEDAEGDKATGCKTLPIVAGITISKAITAAMILLLLSGIIFIQFISNQWEAMISFSYVILFIQIPLILLLVSVIISSSAKDFARTSILAKFIMVTGILSMPVFFYSFN